MSAMQIIVLKYRMSIHEPRNVRCDDSNLRVRHNDFCPFIAKFTIFFASGGISFEQPITGRSEVDHLKCGSRRLVPAEQEYACQQASLLLKVG